MLFSVKLFPFSSSQIKKFAQMAKYFYNINKQKCQIKKQNRNKNMFQILNSKSQNKNGFTLIELLIAISIFTIIIGIVIATGKSFSDTVNLSNSEKFIGTKLKVAKTRSINSLNDTNYGVHFESDQLIIFAGSTFNNSDPANKTIDLPDDVEIYDISLAGGSDLVFSRLTGTTDNFGTIKIRSVKNTSEIRQIVINREGQIDHKAFQTSLASPIVNARHVHYDLGWNIENSTILRLEWVSLVTEDIDATAYFNADKSVFDWSGTTMVDGSPQALRVHGWLDGDSNTVLCIVRDQTENDVLNVYFVDGATTKKITTYTNSGGTINVVPDAFYGGVMTIK